jgi:Tol biopolymer transport system component
VPASIIEGIVVRDTVTGATFFASRADGANGAPMNDAFTPSISANGRRVAFADGSNIWVRDLVTGSTVLASRANGAAGAPANDRTFNPSISADGNRVEFLTTATNLSDGDTDALADVHVRDLKANTTVLADRADGAAGSKANADVLSAALSGDGTHVAFSTEATNLGDGDADNQEDVHVRDLSRGVTRLASVSSGGTKANQAASGASIDGDGTHVAFVSAATNLASTTFPANQSQVWVRDLAGSKTVLASRAAGANGAPGAKASNNAALSADGHVVAFTSASDNLAPSPGGSQLYRRDLDGATTRLVSRASGAGGAAVKRGVDFVGGISANGACLAFGGDGDLLGAVPGSLDFRQSYMRVLQADCGGRSATSFGTFDRTAPLLRSVRLSHKRFRVARGRTALAARKKPRLARGTVLRFTSSEASKLSVVVERVQTRRKGHKVRVRTRKLATLTRTIKVGPGRISFTGRLGKRRLVAGTYRLTLTARDSASNVSKPVRLTFTIVAG